MEHCLELLRQSSSFRIMFHPLQHSGANHRQFHEDILMGYMIIKYSLFLWAGMQWCVPRNIANIHKGIPLNFLHMND